MTPKPKTTETGHKQKRWFLTTYRLSLIVSAFFCLHFSSSRRDRERSDALDSPTTLHAIRAYLPTAASIGEPQGDDSISPVLDTKEDPIGWAAQTFPAASAITGYSGPSNLLVVFDLNRRVLGTTLLESADTTGHVAKIVSDTAFFSQWNGRNQASLGSPGTPAIVSGASLTSEAMAHGLAARFGAADMGQWFPEEVDLETLRKWFPDAASLAGTRVLAADGKLLGTLLRSSRMNVAVRGFQGASDVLVALDPSQKTILGVTMPASRDNMPYIDDVQSGLKFDAPYKDMPVAQIGTLESGTTVMVSGASRTAEGIEETVKEMLRRHFTPPEAAKPMITPREGIALGWIVIGLYIGLSSWRGRKRVRTLFAFVSVVLGGLWLGWMTGQDQWIKSSIRGSLTGTAIPLLVLTATAILIPAIFGKNVYCSQLCPHGAAQQLIGQLRKRRFALPPKWHRFLLSVPWLTLGSLWLLAFLGIGFPFANAEPFEVWSAGFIAAVPVTIFFGGLLAAAFLPQAYCHYGCPTGAILKFLASSPSRWTRRDSIIGAIVSLAWLSLLLP